MSINFVWDDDAKPPAEALVETENLVRADLLLNHPGLPHPSRLAYHEVRLALNSPTPSVIVCGSAGFDAFHLRYLDTPD